MIRSTGERQLTDVPDHPQQNAKDTVSASTLISLAVKLGATPSPYTYSGAVSVGDKWIGASLQANFVKDQTVAVSSSGFQLNELHLCFVN